jgi:hypothetical protein
LKKKFVTKRGEYINYSIRKKETFSYDEDQRVLIMSLIDVHCQCKTFLNKHSIIYVATLFNKCDTSYVFKHNTWYVGILLDVCVR